MSAPTPLTPARVGLPDPSTVVSEFSLRLPAPPVGRPAEFGPGRVTTYRVLRTNQMDPYDRESDVVSFEAAALADGEIDTLALERVSGDHFAGTARRAAKISISPADTEVFTDLVVLIESLPVEAEMIEHDPPIEDDASSDRVPKEHRNVRAPMFLYAASREDDNDFHLIVGTDPETSPLVCMNVELSGLPPESSDHFERLNTVRDAFKAFLMATPFGLPGFRYDFYDPPIPADVAGSIFFDITHATGSRPGPQALRPFISVIWEIHPISEIVLRP